MRAVVTGSVRQTQPIWNQPWACRACQRHGVVKFQAITTDDPDGNTWLRRMVRDVDAQHREASPMCPWDISSKPGGIPKLIIARPYRHGRSGLRIYAQGPTEADDHQRPEVWPPWLGN